MDDRMAEVISEVCAIVGLAYYSIGDFSQPSDCFCKNGAFWRLPDGGLDKYQNGGQAIDYVRMAVLEKLKADGFKVSPGYDPNTGKEVS